MHPVKVHKQKIFLLTGSSPSKQCVFIFSPQHIQNLGFYLLPVVIACLHLILQAHGHKASQRTT